MSRGKIKAKGTEGRATPAVSIEKFNLVFEDNVYLKYAVKFDGVEESAIPDSVSAVRVSAVRVSAFSGCTALTAVDLSGDVTEIGDYAFLNCKLLASIPLPSGLVRIGTQAFKSCTSLKHITFSASVQVLSDFAFGDCSALESVVMPAGFLQMGTGAFSGCTSLGRIYYYGTHEAYDEILIGQQNEILRNVTVYSYSEFMPSDVGNYWHFDASGNIVVWGEA